MPASTRERAQRDKRYEQDQPIASFSAIRIAAIDATIITAWRYDDSQGYKASAVAFLSRDDRQTIERSIAALPKWKAPSSSQEQEVVCIPIRPAMHLLAPGYYRRLTLGQRGSSIALLG